MSPRMLTEAVALSVFIAAASWGVVRAALIGLCASRYFRTRTERRPESAGWPTPRLPGRVPLLVSSILAWPAAITFVLAWGFAIEPAGAWYALLAAWPIVAAVLLVLDSRSPWARLRGRFAAAARLPFARWDEVLGQASDADPQLDGKLTPP